MIHVSDVVDLTLDCFFPRICVGCGRIGSYVCASCEAGLPFLVGPLCPRCGQPQISGILCPACATHSSDVTAIRSVFRFEETVRHAVHELKYRNLRAIAPTLAGYIAAYMARADIMADVIAPVPLHQAHYKRRGYNQAALLAHEVGRVRGIPVLPNALKRTKEGASQVRTKNVEERRRNVQHAFECVKDTLAHTSVVLIDDVCTTGATLESCATALRTAGATEVYALTVAREV